MNFPTVLFYNQNFSTLFTNTYSNHNSYSLIPYQILCKKLLKFENNDQDFQSNVINWIKSLEMKQLIKYCSFKNQWIVDVLHEMILISDSNTDLHYQFIPSSNSENDIKEQNTKLITYINFLYSQKECPRFSDYFKIHEEGYISLSRKKKLDEKEKAKKKFIESIRYTTLSSNLKSIKNNYKNSYNGSNNNNDNEKKDEIIFCEYNNVVTLSYEYLSNIDKLIQTFSEISNNSCFKNPIDIELAFCKTGKKNYYNFKMPKWLGDKFSFAELLCAYFEQSLLINYQYNLLYNEEIPFLYYDQFDELLENIYKLKEFIINSKENISIIQSVRAEEIKKKFDENSNIKKLICDKKTIEDDIRNNYTGKFSYSKKHTIKTIINNTLTTLQKLFLSDKLNFILFITFIKDSIIFTTEDFVIKIVYDLINNYWQSKAAEELLLDINNIKNTNNNTDNKKKKKKKKKKKEEKSDDKNNLIEDNKDNIDNNDNDLENNENNEDLNSNNNEQEIENKIEEDKDKKGEIEIDKNNIENIIDDEQNEKKEEIKNKLLESEEKKEEFEIIDKDNKIEKESISNENIINDINENNNNNECSNNNKIENEEEDNNIKEEDKNKNGINEQETINENNNHKKKKEFFLYPTVKDKKKKNKPKKKEKNSNMNNKDEISLQKENENNNNDNIKQNGENKNEHKKEKTKINNINEDKKEIEKEKINEEEDKKNKINEENKNDIINENNKKNNNDENKEKYKKNKNGYEYTSTKQKNKFNMGKKIKNMLKDNSNIIIQKNFQSHDNINISNNMESSSIKTNNNFMDGTFLPRFTSFNFHSKRKGKNYRIKQNINIYPYNNFISNNNIREFSQEIMDNTRKVDANKGVLEKAREKYIKNIYEKTNIFLKNEKIAFLCTFYGSCISGLSIENSDIDIMVKLKENKNERDYVNRIMNILVDNFNKDKINYITNIVPIFSASVPVIKIECDLCNDDSFSKEVNILMKKCDLSYNDITKLYFDITFFIVENEENKIPSELIIDYIKDNTRVYPQIIDIIYIMKRYLFNKKLNKSYQGGISSYSLFLLILAFIKYYKKNFEIEIGSLLIGFLYYYSNFDFLYTEIRPNNDDNIYSVIEDNSILYKSNLNIIDPITGLNVAKSTFKVDQIKKAFQEGLEIINGNLEKIENNYINNNKNIPKILDIFLAK